MKKICLLIFIIFLSKHLTAQEQWAENLRKNARRKLETAADDQTRFNLMTAVFNSYIWSYPDSAAPYAQQAMLLARKMKSDTALSIAFDQDRTLASLTGNYPQALEYAFEVLKIAERIKDFRRIATAYNGLSNIYSGQGDHKRAILYAEKSKGLYETHFVPSLKPIKNLDTLISYIYCIHALSSAYEKANQLDSALKYIQIVEQGEIICRETWAFVSFDYGNIYSKLGEYPKAVSYYRRGMNIASASYAQKDFIEICYGLANAFKMMNELDSSIFYANKALDLSKSTGYRIVKTNALELLATVYKKRQKDDSAAKYFEQALVAKDSLFNQNKSVQIQNLTFNEQLRQQDIKEEQRKRQYWYRLYILIFGIFVLGIIAILLYRNNKQKQKAYTLLQKQKQETDLQRDKAELTLEELKATQTQMVQREKMASLGELTAGIAHEIQNPLNFVNNFSEVNKEMIDEATEKIDKGNLDEVKNILNDIKHNEEKINHHGKRADGIVKGMLQHSQASIGNKEPTDVNKLADEYLRLAYHGIRAKDKTFNATIKTDFDNTIGKINIVPQDIGRVLLNLYNNAFYVVNEKKKVCRVELVEANQQYEPTVSVSSKKINNAIELTVTDNGNGIPQSIVDKIFQPFFTTKPTGQGTGLGLSLAYDIIKAHGGEIKVETMENQGTTFIIHLPVA